MKFVIKKINNGNLGDINKTDARVQVNSKLVLSLKGNKISCRKVKASRKIKRYGLEHTDYKSYINNKDKTGFLAYVDNKIAGQIILRKNWNNYGYIEDISVDYGVRRKGVGKALINKAIRWAKCKRMPGLMLETQNNNVIACNFYEKCGFKLFGLDMNIYKGVNKKNNEVALYWYLVFNK